MAMRSLIEELRDGGFDFIGPTPQVRTPEMDELVTPAAPTRAPASDVRTVRTAVAGHVTEPELEPTSAPVPAERDWDAEIRSARERDSDAGRQALMFQAFDQIARSASGGANAQDAAYWDSVAKNNKGALDDVKARRELVSKSIQDRLQQQSLKKGEREASLGDASSPQSKAFQATVQRLYPGKFKPEELASVSAADRDIIMDPLKLQETIDARKQAAMLAAQGRKDVRDEKKTTVVNEIQGRANDIETNLRELEAMIGANGTWEMFGSHNQDLDRKVDQIATDMAKLQDPNSVARPGEVELVKKNLIKSGFKNKNSTALDILKSFRNEVQGRVQNAYRVRGLSAPAPASSPQQGPAVAWNSDQEKRLQELRAKKAQGKLASR